MHKLENVLRGTAGTGINVDLAIGDLVRDASLNQVPPEEYTFTVNPLGLQHEDNEFVKFLLECPGTHNFLDD